MVSYLTKRFGQAILTLYTAFTLTFVLMRFIPGGPMDFLRAQVMQNRASQISMSELNTLVEQYSNINPSEPIYVQYFEYLSKLAQGDFGRSMWFQRPVEEILKQAIPWTVFLLGSSILLTFTFGIIAGAIIAYYEGTPVDYVSTLTAIFFNSIPYYVVGILAIYILGFQYGVFPSGGQMSASAKPGWTLKFFVDVVHHAILPVSSLVITGMGGVAVTMRGNSIQVLGEDYIRVAHLRGIPGRRIALRYVGRNAILPMYTGLLISIGFMFGGAVIVEEIFAYQGIGYYLIQAVRARDYPLMMGTFLVIIVAVVVAVLFADLTYSKIDPRISAGGERESH